MILLADTWVDVAELAAIMLPLAAVAITALLCGWKPWR